MAVADRGLQMVRHEGESYLLVPRENPRSYDIVRLKDRLGVGAAFWSAMECDGTGVRTSAAGDVSQADLHTIVVAGIRAGLFA